MDNQENVLEIKCIGTVVKDYMGTPAYAISISFMHEIMTDQKVDALLPFLFSTKSSIAAALGA